MDPIGVMTIGICDVADTPWSRYTLQPLCYPVPVNRDTQQGTDVAAGLEGGLQPPAHGKPMFLGTQLSKRRKFLAEGPNKNPI